MQVSRVEVDTLFVPIARPYSAGGRQVTGNWHVLARLTTSDGVQGHGYIVALRQGLVAAVAQATRELGSQLVGMHVLEVEAAWERLASVGDWVGPGGLLHYAIAPLDIALWDAAGKTLGQPLYRLLGGYRDRVPAYASDRVVPGRDPCLGRGSAFASFQMTTPLCHTVVYSVRNGFYKADPMPSASC